MARKSSKPRAAQPAETSPEAREKVLDSFEQTEEAVDAEAAAIVAGDEPIEEASAAARHALQESENLEPACEASVADVNLTLAGPPAPASGGARAVPYAAGALALAAAFLLGRASARR